MVDVRTRLKYGCSNAKMVRATIRMSGETIEALGQLYFTVVPAKP